MKKLSKFVPKPAALVTLGIFIFIYGIAAGFLNAESSEVTKTVPQFKPSTIPPYWSTFLVTWLEVIGAGFVVLIVVNQALLSNSALLKKLSEESGDADNSLVYCGKPGRQNNSPAEGAHAVFNQRSDKRMDAASAEIEKILRQAQARSDEMSEYLAKQQQYEDNYLNVKGLLKIIYGCLYFALLCVLLNMRLSIFAFFCAFIFIGVCWLNCDLAD